MDGLGAKGERRLNQIVDVLFIDLMCFSWVLFVTVCYEVRFDPATGDQ